MKFFFDNSNNYYALDEETGETFQYMDIEPYDYGFDGLSGFWSRIGNAFKRTGKWIGKNLLPIGVSALTVYAANYNQMFQQQIQQPQQPQQTQQPQQPQQSSLSNSLLPIALIVVGVFLVSSKK